MEERYLAYFDYLGFKEFIMNNSDSNLIRGMSNIYRDIEMCLGRGNYNPPNGGVITADIKASNLNCLNISDTVIFWTNDLELESLKELIEVAYEFNWREVRYVFPIRGALTKGKIKINNLFQKNSTGGSYNISCLFGRGIVEAHIKAESQNWAGTVVESSIIEDLLNEERNNDFIEQYAIKYKVPYKDTQDNEDEYVMKLTQGTLNKLAYSNWKEGIISAFKSYNKSTEHPSVQIKIDNTIKHLDAYRETQEEE